MCERLDNWIGIRGCSDTPPGSGVYINDYPGITTELAAQVADSETVRGQDLLLKCVSRASHGVMADVFSYLMEKGHSWIGQLEKIGVDYTRSDKTYPANRTLTLEFRTFQRYQRVRLSGFVVHASGVGSLSIQVNDESPVSLSLTAGRNELNFEREFNGYDVVTITPDVDVTAYRITRDTCECLCYSTDVFPAELIVFEYCDQCEIAYNYRQSLTKALQLKAAIYFFQEVQASPVDAQAVRWGREMAGKALVSLLGGQDPNTGVLFESEYKQAIKAVAKMFQYEIQRGKLGCFACDRAKVLFTHP